jgi:hypothetical protein
LGKSEKIIEAIPRLIRIAEMGWVKKISRLPWEINSDCRRHLSIIGPRTLAKIKGAPSKPILRFR